MEDEELKLEEIEASHTLGGYRRCRCYSAVRYTIVNRVSKNLLPEGQRFPCDKTPWTCVCERARIMSMGWVLVRVLLCCQIHYSQ